MLWDEPKIFFLERRYFFSIILSEFLKNRVALQLQAYDEQEDLIPLVQFLEAQTAKTWSRSMDSKKSTPHKKLNSFLL